MNDASGVRMAKTKIGRCNDKLKCLYSLKIGALANYISYNPWIENGVQVKDENGNGLMLQDRLEQKWRKPKSYFTNEALNKGENIKDEDRTYFQRMVWTLNDGATVFDLDTIDGEMGYYMLLGSSKIANSEREWREHKWPKAEWYIALENESDSIKYQKNEVKSKAFSALHDNNFTESYKRKFLVLLKLASARTTPSLEQVHNTLFEYIDKSAHTPGSSIEKFNELYNMLLTAPGREEIEARYILQQAEDFYIVKEKQDIYTWPRASGSIVLGNRRAEAIQFLLNPKKSTEVEELVEAIAAKS